MKKKHCLAKALIFVWVAAVLVGLGVFGTRVEADINIPLCGTAAHPHGLYRPGTSYALHSDNWANKDHFNSFLTQALVEGKYAPSPDVYMFASLKFNADWAYPLYAGQTEWKEKGFDQSRDKLFILDKPRDFIGEAHVTWKPNDQWYFRVGKQIVQWGETDGFVLMNQINPIDNRRGLSDVTFESTVIPVWLLRAEYRPETQPTWLHDLNYQFIWNPNADFEPDQTIEVGASRIGIWNPDVRVAIGGPYPFDYGHLGVYNTNMRMPDGTFDPNGMAYGGRITGMVGDARISLNGYYGRAHDEAIRTLPGAIESFSPFDGRLIITPDYQGSIRPSSSSAPLLQRTSTACGHPPWAASPPSFASKASMRSTARSHPRGRTSTISRPTRYGGWWAPTGR